MSRQRDDIRLLDIKECIKRIELYIENINYEQFLRDFKTQDAVIRNLEIIGEAAKNLSEEFVIKNAHIAWYENGRLKDKLIHPYSGINIDIVWTIIQNDIPKLKNSLLNLY